MLFDSKHNFALPTILLGLLLCPWMWGISSMLPEHCTAPTPVRGAGVRTSTCGKGHEEGGLTKAKADRASGVPLDILEHLPPKTRVCLLYCLVLSPLTLLGAVPDHHLALSDKELTYSSS